MTQAPTGLGPFRPIENAELRKIFYLEPIRVLMLELIPITTSPPPGTNDPRVTGLLRRMLYLRRLHPTQLRTLAGDVRALQADRQMIAISAKLISLMQQAFERPWAFPALLETRDILEFRKAFSGVADLTSIAANATAATPTAAALSLLSRFLGVTVSHAVYTASLTNRYYDDYLKKMNAELHLRSVNTALLP